MKPTKSTFAILAAAGMLAAQPAMAAADVRSASPMDESEQMAGGIPSAAWPAILAILAVAVFSVISASSDDDEDFPTSP